MNDLRSLEPFPLDPIEDTLRALMRPWRLEARDLAPRIRIDLAETDEAYTVKAEVPGVRKEDIDVQVDGSTVTIAAETQAAKEDKQGGRVLRQERQLGYSSRSFTLACPVDETLAEADYADGILELKLPKKAASSSKRLSIR